MRKSKFTESQIVAILGKGDAGLPVAGICRKQGISNASYHQWKSKFAGVSVNELRYVRELEAENSRLKKMFAAPRLVSFCRAMAASSGDSIGSRM
jgi:putative transposase